MKDVFYLRSSASCTSVCGSRSRTGSRTPDAATRRRGAAAQPVADSPPCRRRAADSSSNRFPLRKYVGAPGSKNLTLDRGMCGKRSSE